MDLSVWVVSLSLCRVSVSSLSLLSLSIEEVSSETLENSTRSLPFWKRKVTVHIGTPPLWKGEANYISQTPRGNQPADVGSPEHLDTILRADKGTPCYLIP